MWKQSWWKRTRTREKGDQIARGGWWKENTLESQVPVSSGRRSEGKSLKKLEEWKKKPGTHNCMKRADRGKDDVKLLRASCKNELYRSVSTCQPCLYEFTSKKSKLKKKPTILLENMNIFSLQNYAWNPKLNMSRNNQKPSF